MRTPEERAKFCAETCMAARRLGIPAVKNSDGTQYGFFDPMTGTQIHGSSDPNKEIAFESACDNLINHLNASRNGQG